MTEFKFDYTNKIIQITSNEIPYGEIYSMLKESGFVLDYNKKWTWVAERNTITELFANTLCEYSCGETLFEQNSISTECNKILQGDVSIQSTQICDASISLTITRRNTTLSHTTITSNRKSYQITSSNNQILCCDCDRLFSIHAPACPFCGCPLHYIADKYYKQFSINHKAQQNEKSNLLLTAKKDEIISAIQRIKSYGSDEVAKFYSLTTLELKSEYQDAFKHRILTKSIPQKVKACLTARGLSLDIISTRMLEVILEKCSDLYQKEREQEFIIEQQYKSEFCNYILKNTQCDERSARQLLGFYKAYVDGQRGDKSAYSLTVTSKSGTPYPLDFYFFERLHSDLRKKTADLHDQAYKNYNYSSDYLIDAVKGELYLVYCRIIRKNPGLKYIPELVICKLLNDIDFSNDLKYRTIAISENDVLTDIESIRELPSEETVFLVISVNVSDTKVDKFRLIGKYCINSNRYYINTQDFVKIIMSGIAIAQMVPSELLQHEFAKEKSFAALSPESLLKKCGYTVSASSNLDDEKRQKIIKQVIENRIYTPNGIINHLSFLISVNQCVTSRNMSRAIKKWKADISYLKHIYPL